MTVRKGLISLFTIILVASLFSGVVSALETSPQSVVKNELQNVRDYTAPASADGLAYAVDGGLLYGGSSMNWSAIAAPAGVIVSAVAMDEVNDVLYIGAANELALYRSVDTGQNWQRIPLTEEYVGGVTDIAVDSYQRLVYAGTDTAGLFRLRDVGSSMVVSGQLLVDEPILEVAADSTGMGMAFARTQWHLYQAQEFGLSWLVVDSLKSIPTAVAVANTEPATVFVGTMDRGLLKSQDGITWELANSGLGLTAGSRLQIDALAIDPAQPDVLYVATSYIYGTSEAHNAPVGVAMSVDGGNEWQALATDNAVAVAELLPVSGATGAVYALTTQSRTPLAIGNATVVEFAMTAAAPAAVGEIAWQWNGMAAWIVAALAGLALAFALLVDMRSRTHVAGKTQTPSLAQSGR